jgi:hypothetical protein
MPSTKKNATKKTKKEKVISPKTVVSHSAQVNTLFPEKLARANEILRNIKMLS